MTEHIVLSKVARELRMKANALDGTGTITYDLVGVLSHVRDPIRPTTHGHVVLHANIYDSISKKREWYVKKKKIVQKRRSGTRMEHCRYRHSDFY